MRKAVVLLSGGLDSSTLLFHMKDLGFEPTALAIRYGQRHSRELTAAHLVAARARAQFVFVDAGYALMPVFAQAKSSQVGDVRLEVPEGHYSADNMAITVVPNRNMLLIAIAGALAASIGAEVVAYAAHKGDHAQYPDCREEFIESCAYTLRLATDDTVRLEDPFASLTKADIVARGDKLGLAFEETWSCYKGDTLQCGKCGTCVERREAFFLAGVADPTQYEDKTDFWRGVTQPAGV